MRKQLPQPAEAIPGPRGLPVLGSGLDLLRDPLGTYEHAMSVHGDVVRFAVGPGRRLVLHAVFEPDQPPRLAPSTLDRPPFTLPMGGPHLPESRQYVRPLVLLGVDQIGSMQVRTIMDNAEELAAIALLVDPVRWRLYDYLRSSRGAVGRDEAARAANISRNLASFHLDRMAEANLLEVEYRRLSGRTGRGAGRPAKLYRVGARHFAVSLPATRYSLAGRILATAIEERRADEDGVAAARRVAGRVGGELGGELRPQVATRADDPLAVAEWAARRLGYEPEHHGDRIELRNCPFDELADSHLELICQMNRAMLAGLLPGLGADGISAEPVPRRAGVSCCVQMTPSG